jgi:hypothetical protein
MISGPENISLKWNITKKALLTMIPAVYSRIKPPQTVYGLHG